MAWTSPPTTSLALLSLALLAPLSACHGHVGPAHQSAKTPQDMPWARTVDPARDGNVWTRRILADLALRPGLDVGDIGAGAGYFSFRIAPLVGPAGHVWATDLDPRMVAHMARERARLHVPNLTPLKVGAAGTGLRPASVDRLLMVNSLSFPACRAQANRAYLADCARVLRPGGRLVIFRDTVHTPRWHPPYGAPLRCRESTGPEVAKLAQRWFERVSLVTDVPKRTRPGVRNGFLLVLARR